MTLPRALALCSLLTLLGAHHRPPTVFDLDRIGAPPPAIVVRRPDGTALPLAVHGKPTYVFLFASWCDACDVALPWVRAAYAKYGDRVRFIGIDVLDARPAALALIAKEALPFEVGIVDADTIDAVVDGDTRLNSGNKYALPADFILDASGVTRYAWHGVPVERDGTPIDVLPHYFSKLGLPEESP